MSITLGRLTIDDPNEFSIGETISIAGDYQGATLAEATAQRQQLLGLLEAEELVVPFTWSEDATVDGFVKVAAADIGNLEASLQEAVFEYAFDLERVPATQSALAQVLCTGALRTNAHSIAVGATTPWLAIVDAATAINPGTSAHETPTTRAGENNDLLIFEPSSQAYNDALVTYRLAPANWYDSAAVLKIADETVVGRQPIIDLTDWEISNDLVRITPAASDGLFAYEVYDGSDWVPSTPIDVDVGQWGGGAPFGAGQWRGMDGTYFATTPATMQVIHNTPELIAVRFILSDETSGGYHVMTCDLSLRRGARLVHGVLKCTPDRQLGIDIEDAGASTDEGDGSGMYRTSNNGDGDRWVAFSPDAHDTENTDNVMVLTTAGNSFAFAFGMEVDGTASVQPDREADLKAHYYGVQALRLDVVEG